MKNAEGYPELCQTSKMEHFAKIVNSSENVFFFSYFEKLNMSNIARLPLGKKKFLKISYQIFSGF